MAASADSPPRGEEDESALTGSERPTVEMPVLLDADNPLLARVQEQLRSQLTEALKRVKYDIYEKEEAVKQAVRRREELGVELYGVQQQLAQLQQQSEASLEKLGTMKSLRAEADALLAQHRAEYANESAGLTGLAGELRSFQAQVDTINATLGEVDLFNDELRAQIAVTRRATYKAEEDIKAMEREKTRQDFQLDKLNEQLQRLHDEEALYEAQLISQTEETAAAMATLSEAAAEIAEIGKEKAHLQARWKTALVALQKSDEKLQATQTTVLAEQERFQALEAELAGLRKAIRAESETNERVSAIKRKTESEARYLEAQAQELMGEKAKLHEATAVLQATLQSTESELLHVNNERTRLFNATKGLQREADVILNKTREHEDQVIANNTRQIAMEKGTTATVRDAKKIRERVAELEQEQVKLENELARVRLDALNVGNHNEKLSETLGTIVADMQELERLINTYEIEIRRRNDDIQKKQSEVDRLNKVLDSLKSQMADENTGPLEATVHNLTKNLAAQQQECTDLQNYWLRAQRELVQADKDSSEQAERTTELRAQLAVLRQKKLRLDAKAEAQRKECSEYEAVIRQRQFELRRLNERVAANVDAQRSLTEANLSQENDFVKRLQDAEREMVRLEVAVEDTVDERKYLLSDVVEAERQIMLWEKKIQLAKETQNALDPEVGATEVRAMQKEIHRMRLRYASLLRKQEQLVQEMEKAVTRREHIWSRGRAAQLKDSSASRTSPRNAAAKSGAPTTQAGIAKTLATLNKQIKAASDDLVASNAEMSTLAAQQDALVAHIESLQAKASELDQTVAVRDSELSELAWQREAAVHAVARCQRLVKSYAVLIEGKYKPVVAVESLDGAIASQMEKRAKIREALEAAASVHSSHAPVLRYLMRRCDW